ncbi:MAG: [FeFe] hydrogenase H-cluster radical SAM maturase HydE [Faecalimonas sp.]|nr:[FeFe] hydrogenase H-cluster radical SAM maturase HydE [Faecalimonas sp.]
MIRLVDKLRDTRNLTKEEWITLLENPAPELAEYVFQEARKVREQFYGKEVYMRGLIEFSSYCKNDCYYCGLRRSNGKASRYRLTKEEILECCAQGDALGFRTFVLQSGEDAFFTDEKLVEIISAIKESYPHCAVTLSIGEREKESYQKFFDAGAERFLLRHETYNCEHYAKLHPTALSARHRQECLWELKRIGYQVGCGFLVGSPYQKAEYLAEDMLFIGKLQPQMVGIGPFIPHKDTPFAEKPAGSLEQSLYLLGLLRLLLPKAWLPATTALSSIYPEGRELGILAGANVVMPNLTPAHLRKKYSLYDGKLSTGAEAAEHLEELKKRMQKIGYQINEQI